MRRTVGRRGKEGERDEGDRVLRVGDKKEGEREKGQ